MRRQHDEIGLLLHRDVEKALRRACMPEDQRSHGGHLVGELLPKKVQVARCARLEETGEPLRESHVLGSGKQCGWKRLLPRAKKLRLI